MVLDKEIEQFWIALNRSQRAAFRAIDHGLNAKGMPSLKWYDVLWELERHADGLRPFEIEKELLFEQSNLSRQIRKMVDAGLVRQLSVPTDGRGHLLLITEKGKQARREMWKTYSALIQQHVGSRISPCEAKRLADILALFARSANSA